MNFLNIILYATAFFISQKALDAKFGQIYPENSGLRLNNNANIIDKIFFNYNFQIRYGSLVGILVVSIIIQSQDSRINLRTIFIVASMLFFIFINVLSRMWRHFVLNVEKFP